MQTDSQQSAKLTVLHPGPSAALVRGRRALWLLGSLLCRCRGFCITVDSSTQPGNRAHHCRCSAVLSLVPACTTRYIQHPAWHSCNADAHQWVEPWCYPVSTRSACRPGGRARCALTLRRLKLITTPLDLLLKL